MFAYEARITVSAPWLDGEFHEVLQSRADFRESVESMLDELEDGDVTVEWVSGDELCVTLMSPAAVDGGALTSLSGSIAEAMLEGGDEDESADVSAFLSVPLGVTIH